MKLFGLGDVGVIAKMMSGCAFITLMLCAFVRQSNLLTYHVGNCILPLMKKEKSSQYTLRLPDSLREELEKIAQEDERTLANQIIVVLRKFVRDRN